MLQNTEKKDFSCPICFQLIIQPVQLSPCSHLFCLTCLNHLSNLHLGELRCPLCRAPNKTDFKINLQIQRQIELQQPQAFRAGIQKIKQLEKEQENLLKVRINYGNHYEYLAERQSQNRHRWTIYVELESPVKFDINKLVYNVTFELDPTFEYPLIPVNHPPFTLSRNGWGTFEIGIEIKFRAKYRIPAVQLTHELVFQEGGSHKSSNLLIEKNKFFP